MVEVECHDLGCNWSQPAMGKVCHPADYGWSENDSVIRPTWFEGPATPDSLFTNDCNHKENMVDDDDSESELEIETTDKLLNYSDGENGVKIRILRRR